jgi:hypothetical protein
MDSSIRIRCTIAYFCSVGLPLSLSSVACSGSASKANEVSTGGAQAGAPASGESGSGVGPSTGGKLGSGGNPSLGGNSSLGGSSGAGSQSSTAGSGSAAGRSGSGGNSSAAGSGGHSSAAGSGGGAGRSGSGGSGASGMSGAGGMAGRSGSPTVGVGDIAQPAVGPGPSEVTKVGGAPFVLVKNWDFGSRGTIKNTNDLISEFQFHDQFNTIANGTNYGAVTVAPTSATAITISGDLHLPGNMQPVEDAARPYREFTADSVKTYVRPLSTTATNVSVSAHDTGNGSFTAKWKLAKGGSLLGKDLLWETRARMPKPAKAFWFAIWTAGNQWNKGAEMDVMEAFGSVPPDKFHVNSVGGSDMYAYGNWPQTLDMVGVPAGSRRDLTQWHVWTWVYLKDDSFKVYYDGYLVQTGNIHWTLGGTSGGQTIDMNFLFDLGWGHTQIGEVNIQLPASDFPITYEIDYSRVYLR